MEEIVSKDSGVEVSMTEFDADMDEYGKIFTNKVYDSFPDQVKTMFKKGGIKQDVKDRIEGLYLLDQQKYNQLVVAGNENWQAKKGKKNKNSKEQLAYAQAQLALEKQTAAMGSIILADIASEERRANKRLKCKLITAVSGGGLAVVVALVNLGMLLMSLFMTQAGDPSC